MNSELKQSATDIKNWLVNDALPLWSSIAINPATQGSYERLQNNGEPDLACAVRVRVQARQIFVFCLAHEQGWVQGAEAVVEGLADFIDKYGRHPSGVGYVHLLDANNKAIDGKQDLYDHAFHMLANIWRYRAFQNEAALQEAEAIAEFLDQRFQSEHGGWLEGDYAADLRRQNPHMHLFEAFIAGYEATRDDKWLERADAMFALFEKHFFCEKTGALLEYFEHDWTVAQGDMGRIIEPGHMMEWVWLLRNYSQYRSVNVDAYADSLYSTALEHGMAESGLLYDELWENGEVKKGSKRCWPMTELIKASIAQARAGKVECEQIAAKALTDLQAYYCVAPTKGAYIDQLDENDQLVADVAPASTLYHIIVAALEAYSYTGD